MAAEFVMHAPPLQKLFYAPIVRCVWGCLALTPFVLLRSAVVFRIYLMLFFGCLAFMAYDYFVPFRYVSPDFQGKVLDAGGGFSRSGNDDSIAYWISYPTSPSGEDIGMAFICVAPLALAFVYRRYFIHWTTKAERKGLD
jgi:hypothetical protein